MPPTTSDLEAFIRAIAFRVIAPEQPRDPSQRLVLDRPGREAATLLELFDAPFDGFNTEVPDDLGRRLRPLLDVPRMSTLAVAAVLNRAVASMPADQAFVNVGVWQGFTFLAGMAGNPDAACVGVDNFSEFRGPRDQFLERFESHRSPAHEFHDMDYRDYFATAHDGRPIGVYLYDGEHSYENQMEGLLAAKPYLADGCVLIVDDTNRAHPRQATLDFVAERADEYKLVADIRTGANSHPTFWNGLLVIRRGGAGEPLLVSAPPLQPAADDNEAGSDRTQSPDVSLIVLDTDGDASRVARTVESAQAQSWPHVEVTVAAAANGGARAALADALARSTGSHVAFVDASVELRPDAVELSVAYPDVTPFWRPVDESRVGRAQRGIRTAADVDAALAPGSRYVLIADALGMPATCAAGTGIRLEQPPAQLQDLDHDAARAAIERQRADGATHLVVMWNRFEWLDERPGLTAHLDAQADTVLANRRARVFRFRG